MSRNPFIPPFETLPATLPIFPLPGAIVMPHTELSLNIFEPRYLNMVNDAVSSHRLIGMIQPDAANGDDLATYRTGCAGRITQYRETNDCRIEIVLTGVCRFDVDREMPTTRGYRLVVPTWNRFAEDYLDQDELLQDQHLKLVAALRGYFENKKLETDLPMLERLPTARLIDSLSTALPFTDQEKQLLLESVEAETRFDNFIALISGGFSPSDSVTRH